MKTLLDLADRMEKLAVDIPIAASLAVSEVATVIGTDLVHKTPVDESTAISNWIMHLEEPWDLKIDAYRLGSQGSTYEASAAEALIQHAQVLKQKKPGETIFLSNNAEYIRDLNQGSSRQAPLGFIERSVFLGRKFGRTLKLRLP